MFLRKSHLFNIKHLITIYLPLSSLQNHILRKNLMCFQSNNSNYLWTTMTLCFWWNQFRKGLWLSHFEIRIHLIYYSFILHNTEHFRKQNAPTVNFSIISKTNQILCHYLKQDLYLPDVKWHHLKSSDWFPMRFSLMSLLKWQMSNQMIILQLFSIKITECSKFFFSFVFTLCIVRFMWAVVSDVFCVSWDENRMNTEEVAAIQSTHKMWSELLTGEL